MLNAGAQITIPNIYRLLSLISFDLQTTPKHEHPRFTAKETEAQKSRFDRGITCVLWVLAETPALDSLSNHHLLYSYSKVLRCCVVQF